MTALTDAVDRNAAAVTALKGSVDHAVAVISAGSTPAEDTGPAVVALDTATQMVIDAKAGLDAVLPAA